jgi:hypothetical protein
MANNIQYILTHNVDDFTRFGDFIQLEPLIWTFILLILSIQEIPVPE